MPRIEPLTPPYPAPIDQALRRWMPPGVTHEPLTLFRVLHRNPGLDSRVFALGAGLLGPRTSSRCRPRDHHRPSSRTHRLRLRMGGAHAAPLAQQAGLSQEQLQATTDIDVAANTAWPPRHAALLNAVDELHDTAQLSQPARDSLGVHCEDAQLLDVLVLAGWYRTISYLANGILLEEEPWGAPFPAQ
jgi:hypothetical protein